MKHSNRNGVHQDYRPINRREFLRLAALAGGGLALPSVLGGCNGVDPETSEAIQFYNVAARNRPCYLFSKTGNGVNEVYAPCSWEWFYQRAGISDPASVLDTSDVRKPGWNKDMVISLSDDWQYGQPWAEAQRGVGSYCHVSKIGTYQGKNIYNLEYWTLFAFNRVSSLTDFGWDHKGDLVCVQMVYNEYYDYISRIAFLIHGRVIEAFDLFTPQEMQQVDTVLKTLQKMMGAVNLVEDVHGVDVHGNPVAIHTKIIPSKRDYQDGPWWHNGKSNPFIRLAEGADGFVHPCVYFENGSHEPWPNEEGSANGMPNHDGGSYSFIPNDLTLLYPYKNRVNENAPFMYYGGYLGSDDGPQSLQLHKAWYGAEPLIHWGDRIDRDPYSNDDLSDSGMTWPPS